MIENKAKFDKSELIAIFGDKAASGLNSEVFCEGVSIDSRTIKLGNAFVALVGEKIDGHSKIDDAFDLGASLAIVSEKWYSENIEKYQGKNLIPVKDTLIALGALANYHRHRFDIPIIAVAGSNGKTTTKDMIATVLAKKYNVLKTHHNFNNRLGVPLMLFALDESIDFAVIEIGTNEPGEVFILAEMLAPTAGIITNIGLEHLEKLIDIDGVEMEETSLFGYLHRRNGLCFINCDDDRLSKYSGILDKKFTYSSSNPAMLEADIKIGNELKPSINFKTEELSFSLKPNSVGLAAAYNSIAATAVGLAFGVEPQAICTALEEFQADDYVGYARMALQTVGEFLILNDCYNANPSSMIMSLKTLALFDSKPKKLAVLGDMRELGEASLQSHIDVLKFAATMCDEIFTIGENMGLAGKETANSKIIHFDNFDDLAKALDGKQCDYAILLKGSRGMKMETILEKIS